MYHSRRGYTILVSTKQHPVPVVCELKRSGACKDKLAGRDDGLVVAVTMVMAMMMAGTNRYEDREAAAERNGDE